MKDMKKGLCIIIILSFLLTIGARWDIIYTDPVKVAEAFLNAIINNENKKANTYLVKRLYNNNHWINATKKDREEIFPKWVPIEFRPEREDFGYVIIKTPVGNIAVKFEKEEDRWLWASE